MLISVSLSICLQLSPRAALTKTKKLLHLRSATHYITGKYGQKAVSGMEYYNSIDLKKSPY